VGQTAVEPELKLFSETQPHMGTKFTIQLYAPDEAAAEAAFKAAFAEIALLDKIMSDYDPESELSRLSASSPHERPVNVSHPLGDILTISQRISQRSDGAFDVTVGSLTRLWRQARRQKQLPDEAKLRTALESVGYENLKLTGEDASKPFTVQLLKPHMRLDLGGIGQGYAARRALGVLKKKGVSRALINASGDLAASDPPPGEKGWKVGIVGIDPQQKPTFFTFLANQAVTNSGDAFQFTEVADKRYSHIVDPKTGVGLTTRISVTVWHPDAAIADALDTAACVLGWEKGVKLIDDTRDCAALFVVITDEGVKTIQSKRFEELVVR
jgi:thiamine biosynthesis lipoprotein